MESTKLHTTLIPNHKKICKHAFFNQNKRKVKDEIIHELRRLTDLGYNRFVIGLVGYFDIFVTEVLEEYRHDISDFQYYICINTKQYKIFYTDPDKMALDVITNANCIYYTSQYLHFNTFNIPNEYLISDLKMDICYYSYYGDGGTLYAYKQAVEDNTTIALFDYFKEEYYL